MATPFNCQITVDSFKIIARAVRSALAESDHTLRLTASYELLAHTLAERRWSQLSPALPQSIEFGHHDQLLRMLNWLHGHGKMLSPDACEQVYERVCDFVNGLPDDEVLGGWEYCCDLDALERRVCPLYDCAGHEWDVYPAYIVIAPEDRVIDVEIDNELRGSTSRMQYDGREYTFNVDPKILGRELAKVLRSERFLALATRMADDYTLGHDGTRWVGALGIDGMSATEELGEWLEYLYPEQGTVYTGDEYMQPDYYQADGTEADMSIGEQDGIVRINIIGNINLTVDSDIENVYKTVVASIPEDTEVRGLKSALEEYFDLLS